MNTCPRCGGQVMKNYDDYSCIQCGWYEKDKLIISYKNLKWSNREGFHYKDKTRTQIVDR